jgi:hypothetical protein
LCVAFECKEEEGLSEGEAAKREEDEDLIV